MRRPTALILAMTMLLLMQFGCASATRGRPAFGPASIRLSPVFSRVEDDRLEVDVELLDGFGDSVKGSGVLTLRLYEFEPRVPSIRGRQVMSPRQFNLSDPGSQRRLWRRVSRTYFVGIDIEGLRAERTYLLEAIYEARTGSTTRPGEVASNRRYFDDALCARDVLARQIGPVAAIVRAHVPRHRQPLS